MNPPKPTFARSRPIRTEHPVTLAPQPMRRRMLLAGGALVLPAMGTAQSAYPSKAIKIIVPFSAGGTTDILARELAARFTDKWKISVIAENKAGAGGNLGTTLAVQSAPDGYTLLCASVGPIAVSPTLIKKLPYNPLTDLIPIVFVADVSNILVVHPSVPANTVEEFITHLKRNPDSLNYGSTGVGTAAHLTGALFGLRTGTRPQHVPYRGAEALRDLVSGRIQFMFATAPSVIGQIRAGTVRALALTGDERSRALPEIPTLKEKGLASFDSGSWFGLFAPKGTPSVVIDTINAAVNEAFRDPALQTKLISNGADPMGGTPERFASFVKAEIDKWRAVIQETGVQAE